MEGRALTTEEIWPSGVKSLEWIPPHLPMPIVRLLVVAALGQDVNAGERIMYGPASGACAVGNGTNPYLASTFFAERDRIEKKKREEGEFLCLKRDCKEVQTLDLTKGDETVGRTIDKFRELFEQHGHHIGNIAGTHDQE